MAIDTAIARTIKAGIGKIIADLPVSVTYAGNTYTAARGVGRQELDNTETGYLNGYEHTYTLKKADLDANSDDPQSDDEITTPEGIKKILRRRDILGVIVRLDVGDRYA